MAIQFSSLHAATMLLLHVLVVIVLCVTAMPVLAKIFIGLLVLLSLSYYFMRDVLRALPNSWIKVSLLPEEDVLIEMRGGRSITGKIKHTTFVCPYFVVLNVKLAGHFWSTSRIIFSGALKGELFRVFCIGLKFS